MTDIEAKPLESGEMLGGSGQHVERRVRDRTTGHALQVHIISTERREVVAGRTVPQMDMLNHTESREVSRVRYTVER